jgi:hypothetical protein
MLRWFLTRENKAALQISPVKSNSLIQVDLKTGKWSSEPVVTPVISNTTPIATVTKLNVMIKDVTKLDEKDRYNIFYGSDDEFVTLDEVPYQQIVFEVSDFKPLENAPQVIKIWGASVGNKAIDIQAFVPTTLVADIEELAISSDYLIGFVRRVTTSWITGKQFQTVIVHGIRKANMTVTQNGYPITEEHKDYVKKATECACKHGTAEMEGYMAQLNVIRTEKFKYDLQCHWCDSKNNNDDETAFVTV